MQVTGVFLGVFLYPFMFLSSYTLPSLMADDRTKCRPGPNFQTLTDQTGVVCVLIDGPDGSLAPGSDDLLQSCSLCSVNSALLNCSLMRAPVEAELIKY